MPAGRPVSVATRHSPWDSPAVSNRNIQIRAQVSTRMTREFLSYQMAGKDIYGAGTSGRICPYYPKRLELRVIKFLLWCVLLFLCWPLALIALIAYQIGRASCRERV